MTPHVSEKDLILLADGELQPKPEGVCREHLRECWQCRTRLAELEATIHGYVRLQASLPQPDARLARANFRARLAEIAAEPAAASPFWKSIPAAAAVLLTALTILLASGGSVNAEGPKPRKTLTPGETRPVTLRQLCAEPMQLTVDVSERTRREVFQAYGMDPESAGAYEVDYLITPELGGAGTVRNLWPQPYSARWNAGVKDVLEHRLHQLVCQGKVDLGTAQHDISTDWIGAYRKYVSPLPR